MAWEFTYQALVGHLEGAGAGHLHERAAVGVVVGDKVAVQVVGQVRLGDLVPHRHCVGNALHNSGRDYNQRVKQTGGSSPYPC
jgi:hypothetical protein